jgi:hypothetical protein
MPQVPKEELPLYTELGQLVGADAALFQRVRSEIASEYGTPLRLIGVSVKGKALLTACRRG